MHKITPVEWLKNLSDQRRNLFVLAGLWLLTLALYLPALKAGWDFDSLAWLDHARKLVVPGAPMGSGDSGYFPGFVTFLLYRLFHTNPYAWHLLSITLHAANAYLLFAICNHLFRHSGATHGFLTALTGAVLFTICPHISEVVVWPAALPALLDMLLALTAIRLAQRFQQRQKAAYVLLACTAQLLAVYTSDAASIIPFGVMLLAAYYRFGLGYPKNVYRQSVAWFVAPGLLFILLRLALSGSFSAGFTAWYIGIPFQSLAGYLCKPPRYLFHLLFFGRFFPLKTRQDIYFHLGSNAGLITFYNILALIGWFLVASFRSPSARSRTPLLLLAWVVLAFIFLAPMAFPEIQLVKLDRNTYFLDAFLYMLLATGLLSLPGRYAKKAALTLFIAANLFFTFREILYWKQSAYIVNRLLDHFPDPGGKIVLLLNNPQNMNGIPMIGAGRNSQFKRMYEDHKDRVVFNRVYDVVAYNMLGKDDGANVMVHNDSLLKVTLNQWDTWWWYEGQGAASYENEDYRLDMKDMGHWYDLHLKHPAGQYLILFQQGDQWKIVDMKKIAEYQY